MAGYGDHSLGDAHFDAETLTAYALGELPLDDAEAVKQHVAACAACRSVVARERDFARSIDQELRRALDGARPRPQLSFDRIAREWRGPPSRVTLAHRLGRLISGLTSSVVILLLVVAVVLLAPSSDSHALRTLHLTDDYIGPPALVAVALEDGIAIVHLDPAGSWIARHLPHVTQAARLEFSPNGRWLVFRQGSTLHLVETNANGPHIRLAVGESAAWAWSTEGDTLAYTDGQGQLIVFDPGAQVNTVLVPAAEHAWGQPLWSPDGGQIAYAVVPPSQSGISAVNQAVWRVDPATGYRIELARNPNADTVLAPAAWLNDGRAVIAWDARANSLGSQPALQLIDVADRQAVPLSALSLAYGDRLAWPVSPDGRTLALRQDRLITLHVLSQETRAVPDRLQWPAAVEWAPGGAWLAAIVPGRPGGEGLHLYAPDEARVIPLKLPVGASEKAAYWAGPEQLFVIRQPDGAEHVDLWLVSAVGAHDPQRLMTSIPLPQSSSGRWQDALATQVIPEATVP